MITIIAGSRSISEHEDKMLECLNDIDNCPWEITKVISGTARGADTVGILWADKNNIPLKKMPAEWDDYGWKAGHKRNEEMAKIADACIVFWDGKSGGSKNMIEHCLKYKLNLWIKHI